MIHNFETVETTFVARDRIADAVTRRDLLDRNVIQSGLMMQSIDHIPKPILVQNDCNVKTPVIRW